MKRIQKNMYGSSGRWKSHGVKKLIPSGQPNYFSRKTKKNKKTKKHKT
jgi:hypothetical protein